LQNVLGFDEEDIYQRCISIAELLMKLKRKKSLKFCLFCVYNHIFFLNS